MKSSTSSNNQEASKEAAKIAARKWRIQCALQKRAQQHRFPMPMFGTITFREKLPFSCVWYPSAGGFFFAFQENSESEPILCECARYPLGKHLELLKLRAARLQTNYSLLFQIGVPSLLKARLQETSLTSITELLSALRFAPKLCHECNRMLPRLRYCVPMYGNPFTQAAGWYIQKCVSEWGIDLGNEPVTILGDRCPEEVQKLAAEKIPGAEISYREMVEKDRQEANRIHLLVQKRSRRIMRCVENEVRRRFGFPPIGRLGGGELVILHIVRALFPNYKIKHRCRPSFLKGLELDIFIPDLRFAIEVQGQQHFDPVAHWGGDSALDKLIERDRRKVMLCKTNGVKLLELAHDEPLDEGYLRVRIEDWLTDFNPFKRTKRHG